jgi:hypothetical protein
MSATEYTVRVKEYDRLDVRLGRNVRHDSRSLNFKVEAIPMKELVSVDHPVNIEVLDQGQLGSCTGNAGTAWMAVGAAWSNWGQNARLNEDYAVQLYSDATRIDPWDGSYPPEDTGSDGLSIAKVLQTRGLIDRYEHATSLEATLTALQSGAVITGTEWRGDMFSPSSDGRIKITGNVEGGHEYLLRRIDMENQRIWMRNSWGPYWGVEGEAYFTFDDFEELLHADGDVTSMHATAFAPTPIIDDGSGELRGCLLQFMPKKACPQYLRKAAAKWLGLQ